MALGPATCAPGSRLSLAELPVDRAASWPTPSRSSLRRSSTSRSPLSTASLRSCGSAPPRPANCRSQPILVCGFFSRSTSCRRRSCSNTPSSAKPTEGRLAAERQVAVNIVLSFAVLAPLTVGYMVMAPTFEALVAPAAFRGDYARLSLLLAPGLFAFCSIYFDVQSGVSARRKDLAADARGFDALMANLILVELPAFSTDMDGLGQGLHHQFRDRARGRGDAGAEAPGRRSLAADLTTCSWSPRRPAMGFASSADQRHSPADPCRRSRARDLAGASLPQRCSGFDVGGCSGHMVGRTSTLGVFSHDFAGRGRGIGRAEQAEVLERGGPFCALSPRAKAAARLSWPSLDSKEGSPHERFRLSVGPLELVLFRAARRGRSGNRARGRTRTRPPARRDRAHRLGKYRLARRARGAGVGADQQIRRRLSGQALLRRLPVRRHRRERWRSSAPASCSTAGSPMCSPIPAARPIRACSWR